MNEPAGELDGAIPYGALQQLLRQTLGTRAELIGCRVGNRHHDYLVLLIRLRYPSIDVVVKLAGPEAPMSCPFERTAMLHHLVAAQTTIPMPQVLAADTSCRTWPWRYFIKTHVPGLEWAAARQKMSSEELCGAYAQMGDAVAQLHSVHFAAFGELAVDGSVRGSGTCLAALAQRAHDLIRSERLRDLFLSVLEREQQLFLDIRQASLCHEDLHRHNILFEHRRGRWHLATILDFDKAWAGHRETDLARLELWRGMTSAEFWPPYEAICPTQALYRQRRPVYQFLWCLEFARTTLEHLADTRRVCEELGIPCVERFD